MNIIFLISKDQSLTQKWQNSLFLLKPTNLNTVAAISITFLLVSAKHINIVSLVSDLVIALKHLNISNAIYVNGRPKESLISI